jgi:hypothetical protein
MPRRVNGIAVGIQPDQVAARGGRAVGRTRWGERAEGGGAGARTRGEADPRKAEARRNRACASRRIHATPARVTTGTATVPFVTPAPSSRLPIVTPSTATVPTRTISYPTCIVREVRDRWKRTLERHHRPRAHPARSCVSRQRLLQERLSRRMIAGRIGAAAPAAAYRSASE